MGKKSDRGNLVNFPRRQAGAPGADRAGRKLSEILKEMALRLLKQPDAAPSSAAAEVGLLLAVAAWNDACGDPGVRNRHREMLAQYDWGARTPWSELLSADTEQLIAGLRAYKRAHYPHDRRRIVGFGITPDSQIQVQWIEPDRAAAPGDAPAAGLASCDAEHGHPIADKVLAALQRARRNKIVDLRAVVAGRSAAEELRRSIASEEALAGLHPVHAIYVFAQNHVSVLSEQLTCLKELKPLADIIAGVEDEFGSGGPPMSPLTTSYFTSWAFFDVAANGETIGTIILALAPVLGMHADLQHLIERMQRSRMGIYSHQGEDGDLVVLRELVTGVLCRAVVPGAHRGHKGELWYARVLPPPLPEGTEHVVFTTPYVLQRPGVQEWQAYFRRVLPAGPTQARLDAYGLHMKHGPTPTYWPEFVFEGYAGHTTDAVQLVGLPDVAASRPHSAVNASLLRPWP